MSRRQSIPLSSVLALLVAAGCATQTGAEQPDASEEAARAPLELNAPAEGFQVASLGLMVEPGEDVRWCEVLQLPGGPQDVYPVHRIELAMTAPGQELILTAALPGSQTEAIMDVGSRVPCTRAGDAFGEELVNLTRAQHRYLDHRFGEGVGKVLHGGQKLVADYHYFNDGEEPAPARVKVNFHLGEVEQELHTASFENFTIYTPPGGWSSHLAECRLSQDVAIRELVRRTRDHGTAFTVWRAGGNQDGQLVWNSEASQDDRFEPEEPIRLRAGEGFRFQCDYHNGSADELRYGIGAADETCSLDALFHTESPYEAATHQGCLLFDVGTDGIARP